MILELMAIASLQEPTASTERQALGSRPVSVTGADPDAYFVWLTGWADKVAEEWRKDGCTTRAIGRFEPTLWPISQVPANLDEEAAGSELIVERVRVSGCGVDQVENIGVFTGKNGARWTASLMSGEGRTSPRESTGLIGEAFRVAMPHFDRAVCPREEAIRTMRIDPVTVLAAADDHWIELWPVSVCGVVMPVRMAFTRRADGSLGSEATWAGGSDAP